MTDQPISMRIPTAKITISGPATPETIDLILGAAEGLPATPDDELPDEVRAWLGLPLAGAGDDQ